MEPSPPLWERERESDGSHRDVLTAFLFGGRCRFNCTFCDLHRYTHPGRTAPGHLPRQLASILDRFPSDRSPERCGIKLYNASNFFDEWNVPEEDDAPLARLVSDFHRVTVECHARLLTGRNGSVLPGGRRCVAFAESLRGTLEVAIGLETVHPTMLAAFDKRLTVGDFDRGVRFCTDREIAVRAFVLLGLPGLGPDEGVEWAVRSARHALDAGAGRVSLIPLRLNGTPVTPLRHMEHAFRVLARMGRVGVDTWDLASVPACPDCGPRRRAALRRANLTGRLGRRPACLRCDDAPVGSGRPVSGVS